MTSADVGAKGLRRSGYVPLANADGIDISIYAQNSFAPPDAPTVHRMIAYGKRTPEGRSAAIGWRAEKHDALKVRRNKVLRRTFSAP